MPATRSQLRSPPPKRSRLKGASQLETLDTVSTAILPPSYTVIQASNRPATESEKVQAFTRGQECLHDAVRRMENKEGDLRDLIRLRKRRRIHAPSEGEELDRDVLWYTARLRHACSCELF